MFKLGSWYAQNTQQPHLTSFMKFGISIDCFVIQETQVSNLWRITKQWESIWNKILPILFVPQTRSSENYFWQHTSPAKQHFCTTLWRASLSTSLPCTSLGASIFFYHNLKTKKEKHNHNTNLEDLAEKHASFGLNCNSFAVLPLYKSASPGEFSKYEN